MKDNDAIGHFNPHPRKATRRMNLVNLNLNLNECLCRVADTLPKHYKLTLVCRNTDPKFADADIVMGDDDFELAIATINKMKDRDSFTPPP
jgi:hypothetical protein